jgi:hypothetical protein
MNPDQITTRTTISAMRAAAGIKAKPAKAEVKAAKPATARGRAGKAAAKGKKR